MYYIRSYIDWPMQMNIMDMMDNDLYKDELVGKMDLSSSVRVLMARASPHWGTFRPEVSILGLSLDL